MGLAGADPDMSIDQSQWFAAALAAATLVLAVPALAQQTATPAIPGAPTGAEPTKSGYTQGAALEGGDSVTEDLAHDDLALGSVLRFPRFERVFAPWFEGKRWLNERFGLKLQLSYQMLYQFADESSDEDDAAAGRGEIQGTWTLLGRNIENPGLLSFRLENRHTLGAEIPPLGARLPMGESRLGSRRSAICLGYLCFRWGPVSSVRLEPEREDAPSCLPGCLHCSGRPTRRRPPLLR